MAAAHEFRWYRESADAWRAMRDACTEARASIDFESYIFTPDAAGRQFVQVFERKAKEGVRVRILADGAGSYTFAGSSARQILEKAGVQIQIFHPISPWRARHAKLWFFRDHRKILVVDGVVAFLGGVNVEERMTHWRDTHAALRGPMVLELEESFSRMWETTRSRVYLPEPAPRPHEDGFSLLTSAPHVRSRHIYREYRRRIHGAKESVYISTPYFMPDLRFFRSLRRAAARGVDVRLVVPLAADGFMAQFATDAHFRKALKAGIRVYQYRPTMLHSKTILVDNSWWAVGSYNLDSVSFFLNYEISLAGTDPAVAKTIASHFSDDFALSHEVLREEWKRRALSQKAAEYVSLVIEKFI